MPDRPSERNVREMLVDVVLVESGASRLGRATLPTHLLKRGIMQEGTIASQATRLALRPCGRRFLR